MKRRLPPAILIILLAVAVGGLSGCQPKPRRILARTLLVKGGVQMSNSQSAVRALRLTEALEVGSRVSVPTGGAVAISLVPGVAALADEQTELALDVMEMEKPGQLVAERRARVTLRGGTARFTVGSPLDRRIELEVRAPGGATLIAVPGSLFSVVARGAAGGARVECARGAVEHWPGGGTPGSWIAAGTFQDVGTEASPGAARPIFEDAAARREAANLFDAAEELEILQERQRNLTPFHP